MAKTIFNEETVFLFNNDKRNFKVVEWPEFEGDVSVTYEYENLKSAEIKTAAELKKLSWDKDTEFLVLTLNDGSVVEYVNNEVSLFHI